MYAWQHKIMAAFFGARLYNAAAHFLMRVYILTGLSRAPAPTVTVAGNGTLTSRRRGEPRGRPYAVCDRPKAFPRWSVKITLCEECVCSAVHISNG